MGQLVGGSEPGFWNSFNGLVCAATKVNFQLGFYKKSDNKKSHKSPIRHSICLVRNNIEKTNKRPTFKHTDYNCL